MVTARKKTYGAVLLLCVAALAVDQLFLSGDAIDPRSAAGASDAAMDQSAQGPTSHEREETIIPTLRFPFGVQKYATPSLAVDVFVPPPFRGSEGGQQAGTGMASATLSESSTSDRLDRTTFASRYRLDGMIVTQETRLVIIDGTWIRIGESMGGCRLTEIVERDAVFDCFDGQAVLRFSYELQGGGN
ncbi:MAG: hypothetical protein ACE5E5_06945 [Phycisphaerae bacterium]